MKKSLLIILTVLFTLTFANYIYASELGDVNSDAQINASDALAVLKHAAKINTVDIALADVSADGIINSTDALLILKYAARLIPDFSTESITPPAVQIKTQELKDYIYNNGENYEDNYVIDSLLDDTLYVQMGYIQEGSHLYFSLTYAEYFEEENISLSITATLIEVDGQYVLDYYEDFYIDDSNFGYYIAESDIDAEKITSSDVFNFNEYDSYFYTDEDKELALDTASEFFHASFYTWNEFLKSETGLSLKDIGFSNYVPVIE